jgi:hypothetical protein
MGTLKGRRIPASLSNAQVGVTPDLRFCSLEALP